MFDRVVQEVGERAMSEGGGFVQGVLGMPFNALGGAGRGMLNGALRHGLLASAATAGLMFFAPDLVAGAAGAINPELRERIGDFIEERGPMGVALASAAVGLGGSAALGFVTGGIGGAINGFTGREEGDRSSIGGTIGKVIGFGAVASVVAAVAINLLRDHDVSFGGEASGDQTPTLPPANRSRGPETTVHA